jgi:hypothetical protein
MELGLMALLMQGALPHSLFSTALRRFGSYITNSLYQIIHNSLPPPPPATLRPELPPAGKSERSLLTEPGCIR